MACRSSFLKNEWTVWNCLGPVPLKWICAFSMSCLLTLLYPPLGSRKMTGNIFACLVRNLLCFLPSLRSLFIHSAALYQVSTVLDTLLNSVEAAVAAAAKSLQSCLTLCDPIDGSPPGSPVPGILQARTLEWVAISFSDAWKWKKRSHSVVSNS